MSFSIMCISCKHSVYYMYSICILSILFPNKTYSHSCNYFHRVLSLCIQTFSQVSHLFILPFYGLLTTGKYLFFELCLFFFTTDENIISPICDSHMAIVGNFYKSQTLTTLAKSHYNLALGMYRKNFSLQNGLHKLHVLDPNGI